MVKMQFEIFEEVKDALKAAAAKKGITPNILARLILHERFSPPDTESKSYTFTAKNWREIEAYVEERKLGNVATFAAFAMHQYMSRNSLSAAQKRRVEERYGISMDC
jgi:hypothetical protein